MSRTKDIEALLKLAPPESYPPEERVSLEEARRQANRLSARALRQRRMDLEERQKNTEHALHGFG
ncbi:MAG: hypothetical protein KGJ34_02850 [Patescibacteria group bacterium]|nr:hypothetical protein [Patescibacteria group bacterium]